ncbi:MAG: hypothetical protein FWC95_04065 [Defluviitaleaceae bacterium]|nr:hypothetical protein [Defluviitaleaceae bacterium]
MKKAIKTQRGRNVFENYDVNYIYGHDARLESRRRKEQFEKNLLLGNYGKTELNGMAGLLHAMR